MPKKYNYISVTISAMIIFGIAIHGLQIDNATSLVKSTVGIMSESSAKIANLSQPDQHPQSEVGSFTESSHNISSQSPTQPSNDNDKKYVIRKRIASNGFDSEFFWPTT